MATSYYFWGHQRVGLLIGREKMVYWCMPLFVFSLFFLPLSFFLSILFLLLISNYYLAVSYFPFGLFFSWVPLSRCLLLSYHGFFPLSAIAPLSLFSFGVFPLFRLFSSPFFCHGYLPFIVNWFNGISPFYP